MEAPDDHIIAQDTLNELSDNDRKELLDLVLKS